MARLGAILTPVLVAGVFACQGVPMPPSTADMYLVGKLGSYCVPTIAKIDAAIVKLTAQIESADRARRERIWADVDALLERRSLMSLEAAL